MNDGCRESADYVGRPAAASDETQEFAGEEFQR
jgi:hypothetical protein